MVKDTLKGALVAGAVAALFAAGPAHAKEKTKEAPKVVRCGGVNECKGKGACAGADNSCASQNACKGQGWVEMKSAKECKAKGGKVLADT